MRSGVVVVAGVIAMTMGCIGSDGSSSAVTYDAAKDCREWLSCEQVGLLQSECVVGSEAWYSDLSASDQRAVDRAFASCQGKASCEYGECFDDIWFAELTTDDGDPVPVPACTASTTPSSTSVPYDAGTLDFASAEVLFWVNFEGCLTEVDIDLKQGECTLHVTASDFTDSEGRLLIRRADLRTGGLCPGFPDAIEKASSWFTDPDLDGMLGTIEVVRPSGSWSGCEQGEVILRSNIKFVGFDGPALDLSSWTVSFAGTLTGTHTSLDDPCPTEYF